MKAPAKAPVAIVLAMVVLALVVFLGMKAMGAGDLDQGQVKYTPGKPPWLETDPAKRGPGASPAAANLPEGAPVLDNKGSK